MGDLFSLNFPEIENWIQRSITTEQSIDSVLNHILNDVRTLSSYSFYGQAADRFAERYREYSYRSQALYDELCRMSTNMQRVLALCRQFDDEIRLLFSATPGQRHAAVLGISLSETNLATESSLSSALGGVDLNPDHYQYDFHKRAIQRIEELQGQLGQTDNQLEHLKRMREHDVQLVEELRARLNSPVVLVDKLVGTEDTYRDILAEAEQRNVSWDSLIERATERQRSAIDSAISQEVTLLALPGDPDVWLPLKDQAGNKLNLHAGCTAFVAERTYIPFSKEGGGSAGNASEWVANAERFASNPDNQRYGVTIDSQARVGAIVSFDGGNHVGVVVRVDEQDPTKILVAQADTRRNAAGEYDQPWGTYVNPRERWESINNKTFIHLPWNEYINPE